MKIALLSAFYPYRGGIAQFGAMLYRALEEQNDVKAFTFKKQYPGFLFPGKSQYVGENDNPDAIIAERILDTTNPFSFISTSKKINSFAPELFISQYWMSYFAYSFGAVHKRINKSAKRITILHNVIPHEKRFFDKSANKFFLRRNDGFVVLSDAVLKDLLSIKADAKYLRIDHPTYSQFGTKKDKLESIKKLNLPIGNKYLLFFGFIRDYKGLDILLESMVELANDFHLIIAGEVYGSFDKYERIIQKNNLRNRVHIFDSYIDDDGVSDFFSASDVCILPYKSATQSGITAISHHFNLPVIATDVGGLKEKTRHQITGLIVNGPDPLILGAAIQEYFQENLMEKFSQNIEAENAQNTWEIFAKKLIDFSKSLS